VVVGWVMVVELGPLLAMVAPGPADVLVVMVVCGPEVMVVVVDVEVAEDTSGRPLLEGWSPIAFQKTNTIKRCCLRYVPFENQCFGEIDSAELGARGMMYASLSTFRPRPDRALARCSVSSKYVFVNRSPM